MTQKGCEILRLASFVTVICIPRLTRGDWRVVNELEKVLAEPSNDGQLLGVLAKSVELVGECRLQLFTRDVGQLSFSDKRFGFGTDKLLLKDNDPGRVWLFVFELCDLVGDLLLAYIRGQFGFDAQYAN